MDTIESNPMKINNIINCIALSHANFCEFGILLQHHSILLFAVYKISERINNVLFFVTFAHFVIDEGYRKSSVCVSFCMSAAVSPCLFVRFSLHFSESINTPINLKIHPMPPIHKSNFKTSFLLYVLCFCSLSRREGLKYRIILFIKC